MVLGVDAATAAMAEASRRAARRGPANAVFVAVGAETLADTPLAGRMDLVTVTFPWGSLLRGVLGLDGRALTGIAALPAPGGRIEVLASVMPADRVEGIASLEAGWEPAMCRAWAAAGIDLVSMRLATTGEVAASGSSWARRLCAPGNARPVWRFDLRRRP